MGVYYNDMGCITMIWVGVLLCLNSEAIRAKGVRWGAGVDVMYFICKHLYVNKPKHD